jgi:sterol desaturase/sphingolipid hydroxylase (fatty acid hydroxylase superfamily)
MFQSDLFEFFSRIPPWQPPAIFLPIIAWTSYVGLFVAAIHPLAFVGLFAAGVLIWQLLEYWLHRVLFHYEPSSKIGKRFIWYLHGVHHDWPHDKLRLVFPPAVSVPLAILIWIGCTAVFGETYRYAAYAGIAAGYLFYDMAHYYVHHFSPRTGLGKALRRYHLSHHFKNPEAGFGVSNPLLDYVFRTVPPVKKGE